MINNNEFGPDFPTGIKTELDDYMARILERILTQDSVFFFKAEDQRVTVKIEPYKLINNFEAKVLVGNFLRRLLDDSDVKNLASCGFVGREIISSVKACEIYHEKPGRDLVLISKDCSMWKAIDENSNRINSDQEVILVDVLASEVRKVLNSPPVKIKEVVLFFGSKKEFQELQSVCAPNIKLYCLFSMEGIIGEYLKRLN